MVLRLRFLEEDEPLADEPFVAVVGGRWTEGRLGPDGLLELPVDPAASHASIRVGVPPDAETYSLSLGGLDPVTEVSGVQARLRGLGIDPGPRDGVLGSRTRAAIQRFQRDFGVGAGDGILDRETLDRLREEFGA